MVFTSRFLIFQKRYKNSEKLYEWVICMREGKVRA